MNATQNPPASVNCPKCSAPNAAGARFCGVCGTPLQGGVQPPAPTPAPPPPPPMPAFPGSGARLALSGGSGAQTTINADIQTAFGIALQGVQSAGAQVRSQTPPYSIRLAKRKGGSLYEGDLVLSQAGPAQTVARLALKPSAGGIILMVVVSLISIMMWGAILAQVGMLLGLGLSVFFFWKLVNETPRELSETMLSSIPQGPVASMPSHDFSRMAPMPSHDFSRMGPPPVPAPPRAETTLPDPPAPPRGPLPETPAAPPVASGAPRQNVVERLKQLAELRELGALTQEEFEAKKAELLRNL